LEQVLKGRNVEARLASLGQGLTQDSLGFLKQALGGTLQL
jgi:hypothetical protein